jgi:transposase
MLAIASALKGESRAEAARLAGMERQALRDALMRYNAEGLEGLRDRHILRRLDLSWQKTRWGRARQACATAALRPVANFTASSLNSRLNILRPILRPPTG